MTKAVNYGGQNKGVLLLGCLLNLYQQGVIVKDMVFVLLIIASSLVLITFPSPLVKLLILVGSLLLSIFFIKYVLFFPILLYDLLDETKLFTYVLGPFMGVVLLVISYANQWSVIMCYFFLCLLALYFHHQTSRSLQLTSQFKALEASSQEQQFLLEKQNHTLMEEQNLNLSLGISEERNRIARDIHDNVGHLLSSALIQIGALHVLNHDPVLVKPLLLLTGTVQEGMDNIRDSVHNIRDDSLNFKQALLYITESFHDCPIEFRYDLKGQISPSLKMDFLMIVRESFANIMKHSQSTHVILEVVEQPAFYRVVIRNVGRSIAAKGVVGVGMGLNSMAERIAKQGGRLTTEQQADGFQVLAIVPKEQKEGER